MQSTCQANRELLFNDRSRKSCWLPTDTSSPWGYCRHCSFTQKDSLIDQLLKNLVEGQEEMEMPTGKKEKLLSVVEAPWFQEHCAHPASKLRLYHLMHLLRIHNRTVYKRFLRNPALDVSFGRLIQTHRPSDSNLTSCHMICDLVGDNTNRIPRQCPNCLYILWSQNRDKRDYYMALTRYIESYQSKLYKFAGPNRVIKEYLRYTIPRINGNKNAAFNVILMMHVQNNEGNRTMQQKIEGFYHFLQDFLLEDRYSFAAIVSHDIEKLLHFCPDTFQQEELVAHVIQPLFLQWKTMMKARCDTYKEDLMIKTCHPSRLFKWIFDIEDLKDFEPYDEERDLVLS